MIVVTWDIETWEQLDLDREVALVVSKFVCGTHMWITAMDTAKVKATVKERELKFWPTKQGENDAVQLGAELEKLGFTVDINTKG